jgi:DNA-binding CsgD family transcriptional regulator
MEPYMIEGLSPRQNEVLKLLGSGKKNKEIALIMGIKEGTVKHHLKITSLKLGCNGRVNLALTARKEV